MPEASIIIRTRNEAAGLPRLLGILASQQGIDFEIIGVDCGSIDNSLRLLEESGARVLHIDPEEFSYGRALNMGCAVAGGDYLVLLSAHAFPQGTDWLRQMIAPLKRDPQIAGTSGAENGRVPGIPGASVPVALSLADYEANPYAGLVNSNAAIRRELWSRFPFNEDLTGAEDKEWTWRVLKAGFQVVLLPGLNVDHLHRESLVQSYNRGFREHLAFKAFGAPIGNYSLLRFAGEVIAAPFRSLGGELSRWALYSARCWGKYRALSGKRPPQDLYSQ